MKKKQTRRETGSEEERPKKKKSSRILNALFVIVFAVGFLVLNYPGISNIWNQYRQSQLISDYNAVVAETDDETLDAMWDAAEAYNEELVENGSFVCTDAFSDEEDSEESQTYNSLLDLAGDGVMGSIEIPKLHIYLSIGHGLSDEVLQEGVGHMQGSSLPVGGTTAHCILAAHRGLPSAELFTDLDQMEEGDEFYLHILGRTLKYETDSIETVLPEDVSSLTLDEGQDYVTLVTCTPYGVNSHRLLVRGKRVPYDETEEAASAASPMKSLLDWFLSETVLLISCIVLLLLIIYFIARTIIRLRKRRRR